MYVIGVTGGIGTGKSTVARLFGEMGLPVLDADQISHDVTAPDGAAVSEVLEAFGPSVLEEGSADSGQSPRIDRARLADLVFADKNKLDKLSSIVHHWVIEELKSGVARMEKKKIKACVLDVPIPVKEGFLDLCDLVLVVWAEDDVRIERLARRGMGADEARRRMAMQMTEEEYSSLADEVIRNDRDIDELRRQVMEIAERELRGRGIPLQPVTLETAAGLIADTDYADEHEIS